MGRAFDFLQTNELPEKPRDSAITEIRGPYYDPMGPRELKDILDTVGEHVDIYKFSGGSFALFEEDVLKDMLDVCHDNDVDVSTGGFIENVIATDRKNVKRYIEEADNIGFDVFEISSGFLAMDIDDLVDVTEYVSDNTNMKPKPEVNVQFGAGGASNPDELSEEVVADPEMAIEEAERHLDAGAYKIMVESEGITEEVHEPRTDIAFELANGIGVDNCVFEAADPDTFEFYVKQFGPEVNLFVDNSQIVELECLRHGLWGRKSTFGRVTSYDI